MTLSLYDKFLEDHVSLGFTPCGSWYIGFSLIIYIVLLG